MVCQAKEPKDVRQVHNNHKDHGHPHEAREKREAGRQHHRQKDAEFDQRRRCHWAGCEFNDVLLLTLKSDGGEHDGHGNPQIEWIAVRISRGFHVTSATKAEKGRGAIGKIRHRTAHLYGCCGSIASRGSSGVYFDQASGSGKGLPREAASGRSSSSVY